MADSFEPFTLVERSGPHHLFDDFQDLTSAKTADHDIQYLTALRKAHPELIVTSTPATNCNLIAFAASGNAVAELDTDTDSVAKWRGWVPSRRRGQQGGLGEVTFFAKYHYSWKGEDFILYTVSGMQYVLKEPQKGEHVLANSSVTDALLRTVGQWQSADEQFVWVYDNYWVRNKDLWNEVQKAEWKDVILDEGMKKALTEVSEKFFDNKEIYEDLGVPWKRGVIFYGPPGNGKTISIKALMHTLMRRKHPIPTLYVKNAPNQYHIRNVFSLARQQAPCLLVFEDIDTIVTAMTRSYFFNEVDGLENNQGILMVASTNHINKLDPGISKRPSRFDRKYLFPLPSHHERVLYCEFWRKKLQKRPSVEFPEKLSSAIAGITDGFSFAYMQEAFVAALLIIARNKTDGVVSLGGDDDHGDLGRYELWRVIKEQIRILREDMKEKTSPAPTNTYSGPNATATNPEPDTFIGTVEASMHSLGIRDKHVHEAEPNASGPEVSLGAAASKMAYITPTAFEWRLPRDSV